MGPNIRKARRNAVLPDTVGMDIVPAQTETRIINYEGVGQLTDRVSARTENMDDLEDNTENLVSVRSEIGDPMQMPIQDYSEILELPKKEEEQDGEITTSDTKEQSTKF